MADETASIRASIVLIGNFNPAIFSPGWFAKNGIISDLEMEAAQLAVVHPEITQFRVEHLSVDVNPSRFFLQIETDPFVRVLDIALMLFGELLPHTPVTAVGINYQEVFLLDSWKRRVALGRELAPLKAWGDWAAKLKNEPPEAVGGMLALIMREQYEPASRGFRRVDVAPSDDIAAKSGVSVSVSVNDHRNLIAGGEAQPATAAAELLRADFDQSLTESKKIVSDLLTFANGLKL